MTTTSSPSPRPRRMASLQAHLSAVMLVATVPLALVLTYHLLNGMQVEHERLNDELQHQADTLAGSVERELQASADALTLLAVTARAALPAGSAAAELGALADAMGRALPTRPEWHSLYLRHPDGPLLFDSATGLPTPAGAPPSSPRVSTGGPQGLAALEVPWRLVDGRPCVLGARLSAAHWQRLADARRPGEGFSSVIDRQGRLVAQAGALSTPLGPALLPPAASAAAPGRPAEGQPLQRSVLADGAAIYTAWRSVPTAGWRVAVGRPAEPLDTAQRQATIAGLATIAASLVLGLALATLVARRVTDPLKQLATRGPSSVQAPQVQEIAWLRDALLEAYVQEAEARSGLQRKAAEFETLFASTPIGLAFLRGPKARTLHNAAMDELVGPADPAGEPATSMRLAGRTLALDERPLQQAAATGRPVGPLELELTSAGRAPRHVLVQAVPLLDADGRPQGALATMVDISARKRAEQRVREADSALQQSQRMIELAHEAGEIGFFRVDVEAATWTPGQARLFGIDPAQAEAPGSMDELLERIHPDDRPGVEQQLRAMVASRRERDTLDFRVLLPDGSARWLSNRVLMTFGPDGTPRDLTGATLDITEQKAAELERATLIAREQQARIEAESASRAKDEFLAMLGHELRNPLGAIASATEVMGKAEPDSTLAGNARAIITRQTRHLARLVDDLLDVGRVISGKVELSRHPLDLAALVRRVVESFQLTGAADRHHIELALDAVWVVADATRMEQVLNNLLGNALKYSADGTRIAIELAARGGEAVLQVRDEGEGIAPELLPHVFDLFVQGERRLDRRSGGLGIGLTLVRRLVELHGGQVRAESSPQGSCFTVRLPATPPPTSATRDQPDPHRKRRRVLVVEDNADALWAMQTMLEFDGHAVSTAPDGREGLARLLDEQPEVAIIDIGLPGLTGFEVALRSRRAGFAGRLLALTGYGGERDAAEALRHGFDAHIAKPIDPDRLRQLLAQP